MLHNNYFKSNNDSTTIEKINFNNTQTISSTYNNNTNNNFNSIIPKSTKNTSTLKVSELSGEKSLKKKKQSLELN